MGKSKCKLIFQWYDMESNTERPSVSLWCFQFGVNDVMMILWWVHDDFKTGIKSFFDLVFYHVCAGLSELGGWWTVLLE